MTTKCLIVDDEPLAIELLETHIAHLEQLEIVGTCTNAIKAMNFLQQESVDLIFLDIQMPMLTGIEFLKSLKQPPSVIFTTAYRDYAIEGFELDAVDYLLKPISFDRFFKAINRYFQLHQAAAIPTPSASALPPRIPKDYLYLKINKKHHKIILSEIRYIESIKDYIKIHLADQELVAKEKISEFEQQLPSSTFLRIHRSFIINLAQLSAYTAQDVEIGSVEIPIGVSYKTGVMQVLARQ